MKRIDLTKFGFERCPEKDFSDDGNRFTCYKVGRILVTKLVSQGDVYISGRIENGNKLSYDEYSKLPHYNTMDNLNGVTLSQVTENDIQKFYEDCQSYSLEYENAESKTSMPTYKEILDAYRKIRKVRINEYNDIVSQINVAKVLTLDTYALKTFQQYFNLLKSESKLNIEDATEKNVGTAYSKSFVNPISVQRDCQPSYHYTYLLDLIDLMKE